MSLLRLLLVVTGASAVSWVTRDGADHAYLAGLDDEFGATGSARPRRAAQALNFHGRVTRAGDPERVAHGFDDRVNGP